jgi:carbonic anhydrase
MDDHAPFDPIAEALAHNEGYRDRHGVCHLPTEPSKHLAVVTCMDSRLDLFGALGLELGEAHIIRNAGGIATDDVVRSLVLSQRLLGTDRIMVIHHTFCGLENLDEVALRATIEAETGTTTQMHFGSFASAADDVRETVARLNAEPALRQVAVSGFVFDVDTGALELVELHG